MIKVYVDNAVLSRIYDARISDVTATAIEQLSLADETAVSYVTSEQTRTEMMATSDAKRRAVLRLLFRLMDKVPPAESTTFLPATLGSIMLGASTLGGGAAVPDPLLVTLGQIFQPDDALHIFQAVKNQCDYFLTLDDSTILEPAITHQATLAAAGVSIEFVNPLQLAGEIQPTPGDISACAP